MMDADELKRRATLYRKIAHVTAAVARIPKNGFNAFHRYNYATESDITDGLRALLAEHGLAFLPPSVIEWQRDAVIENPKIGARTRVHVQFALGCTETGELFTASLWGEGADTGDKGFYKAYTGAVKYFLMKTFLIATGDDPEDDSRDATSKRQQPASYEQPAPAAHIPSGAAAILDDPNGLDAARDKTLAFAASNAGRPIAAWPQLATYLNTPNAPMPTTINGWRAAYKAVQQRADELAAAFVEVPA